MFQATEMVASASPKSAGSAGSSISGLAGDTNGELTLSPLGERDMDMCRSHGSMETFVGGIF